MPRTKSSLAVAAACLAPALATAAPFKCPRVGGDLVFGQEANVNSLDQMASNTISTRNVAMNIFEALMTRDENNNFINDLAASMTEAPDHLSYTFKLRDGVHFHNGKPMTSADVAASFDRYKRMGFQRSTLDNVAGWDTPDASTFVIRMARAQPTFIELLSSFSVPIVIIPAEYKDDPPMQLHIIGTGPFKLDSFTPGSQAKLLRFDGYAPNTAFEQRTGFGGYKQACLDSVTFRIVTEASARVAGLQTGELQGVEDVPTKAVAELKKDPHITILPLANWWIQIALPNVANPPTDNPKFRQAVQAVLGMDDIMDAASDGNYRLNIGFGYPNQPTYTDAGKGTYNINDPDKAKALLKESGYKGEPVVILTNRDYPSMYNAALVQQQQLQSIGINAQLKVVDWPTSIQIYSQVNSKQWNFMHTGWGTQPALGPLATMQFLAAPNEAYWPPDGKPDADVEAAWSDMNTKPSATDRQAAYATMQRLVLERAYAYPFGSLTKVQAVRSNVQNFVPFRIPRFANVSLSQ